MFLAPPAGFEPATLGLEVPCSIQLGYGGNKPYYSPTTPDDSACGNTLTGFSPSSLLFLPRTRLSAATALHKRVKGGVPLGIKQIRVL